ncbi:hypothetical protein AB205_0059930 [Aquarana catesbeiana]|uniref:Uncharacterized protein n=1 Tax=Aquarana catesbeiana TaxID=8400 RepID=A0A2G9PUB3_AQUCT|nr:hypothetical protein AB205_0059930 [Aquarana catesbeiana]
MCVKTINLLFLSVLGAFLIPYVIMLALAGLPLLFLECSLGQFASLGPIEIWRITPFFQDRRRLHGDLRHVRPFLCPPAFFWETHRSQKTAGTSRNAQRDLRMCSREPGCEAARLHFLILLPKMVVPPPESRGTDQLRARTSRAPWTGVGFTMVIISTLVSIYYNVIFAYSLFYLFSSFRSYLPWNDCYEWADSSCQGTINGFCNVTLDNATITMNMSSVHEQNLTCIADNTTELPSKQYWDKVALKRSSGMDETGTVVWHLALCLLLAWIITAAALVKGIKSSGKVWRDAATQIFYSLNTAWGGLIALSSYNKFQNNCYWDSIVVSIINCLTSILAGFAIFSILGHMALVSGKKVPEVVDEGFGLAFIAYPDALARLPVSPLWSILFFCMLLALGLDSQFALIVMKKLRIPLTTAICAVLFLLGLPCVTQAGIYWVNLIDSFCGGWALLFAAVLELVAVIWIYGGNRVILDIEMMLGKKHWIFWLWWRVCWYFVSPVLLAAILIWSLVTYEATGYGGVVYPKWAIILGFLMVVFCLIWIPVIAIVKVVQAKGNIFQRIASCCRPTENWGPALVKNRGERYKDMKDDTVKEEDEGVEIPDIKGVDNVSFQRD